MSTSHVGPDVTPGTDPCVGNAEDDRKMLLKGKALVSLLKEIYEEARVEWLTSGGSPEAFPGLLEWIPGERWGRLSTIRYVEDANGWRYTR